MLKKNDFSLYLWAAPAFFLAFIFIIAPAAETVYISFHVKRNASVGSIKSAITGALEAGGAVKVSGRSRLGDMPGSGEAAVKKAAGALGLDTKELGVGADNSVQEAAEIIAAAAGKNKKTVFAPAENYSRTFADPQTVTALKNNALWIVLFTFATVFGGLALAALFESTRWSSAARTVVFMPMALSFVAAGIIWAFMYDHDPAVGTVNAFLKFAAGALGCPEKFRPVAFLANPSTVNAALIVAGIWVWTGFCVVIFTAALRAVPREIIEAAIIDGASPTQIFFKIKLPSIRPAFILVSTAMAINVLKIFDIVYAVTGGGPFGSSEVLATRMYRSAFIEGGYEQAAAMATVLLLATIPVAIMNCRGGVTAE